MTDTPKTCRDLGDALVRRALVTPLHPEGKSPLDLMLDMGTGIAIRRHNADGTVKRIDPADFYAKPEDAGDA